MRPGCWHATRVLASEATCLMLTRQSTTADLIGHLTAGHPLAESAFCDVRLQLLR
jgi:ureidoglycolate lyase